MTVTLQVDVATDLAAIIDMAGRLEARAIDRARDRTIPGGDPMVELANSGSPHTWANRVDWLERRWLDLDLPAEDMPNWSEAEDPDELWPAQQILEWWTEDYRARLGMYPEEDDPRWSRWRPDDPRWRPTLLSEALFLRNADVAAWIWDNEPHYDDFAKDVARARAKLEGMLREGHRTLQGVPCMYDECKGRRLQRKLRPKYEKAKGDEEPKRARDAKGNGLWDFEDWRCPACKRTWTEDEYARNVTAAGERAKVEDIDGATWCSADYAARKVDRSVKTVRTWINREELATLCLIVGRRLPFVCLDDVRELAEGRARRKSRTG